VDALQPLAELVFLEGAVGAVDLEALAARSSSAIGWNGLEQQDLQLRHGGRERVTAGVSFRQD
jgi:hypothetical protein